MNASNPPVKKNRVVHPLLVALCIVLTLYWANVGEVSLSDAAVPVVVTLGAAMLLQALARAVLRDRAKAGLLISVFLVLLFSYGHVRRAFLSLAHGAATAAALGFVLLSWLISSFFIWRTRRGLSDLTRFMNAAALVSIVVLIAGIIYQEARSPARYFAESAPGRVTLSKPDQPVDIYYIILDRYAGATTLRESYDFDNGPFIGYLESRGFFVAADSHSNYLNTQASLASSLNMEYLDGVADRIRTWDQVYRMLKDYRVWRLLKSAGYEFVHIGSWWDPTRTNKYADVNINHAYLGGLPEFSVKLLEATALSPLLALWKNPGREHWKEIERQFDELAQLPAIREPTFVFAHVLATHPDYVVDENGQFLTDPAGRTTREMYVDSIRHVNRRLRDLVESLFSKSERAPVIILQSDEGPLPGGGTWRDWPKKPRDSDYIEKSGIFNAYCLPGIDTTGLHSSLSPVNTFRIVFNSYFMAGLDLLPDKTYSWKPGLAHNSCDVTDRVRRQRPAR